ncbi:MAG: S8 family serine peptidase [Oscillospiraceae bacterium]|nr:S8 family serine peptidase [Oscillospiraceae bacterium]
MKKLLLFIPLLFFTGITASAETIYTRSADEYVAALYEAQHQTPMSIMSDTPGNADDEYILLLKSDTVIDDCGAQYDIYDEYGIHTLIYSTAEEADAAYEYYLENDYPVCYDMELEVADITPSLTYAPYLSWGVRYIGSDLFRNGLQKYYGSVGSMPSVTVAVVDTGIDYEHPRLKDRIDKDSGCVYYTDEYGNIFIGDDPMDNNHHGTHVAGIIADNTSENVKIIPIKISEDGNTSTKLLEAGLKKAIELDVDVINISISSPEPISATSVKNLKTIFNPLFRNAEYQGITICVSAGNCTSNNYNAEYIFPSFMESAITVANCQSDGTISKFSNYGSVIDLAAPGTNIYSTYPVAKGSYASLSGTSMAAPFVSASAALLITMDPGITPEEIDSTLKDHLKPLFVTDTKKSYGDGVLYIGDIYEYTDIPIYDAMTGEFSGANVMLTIDNSKNILRNGAYVILKGTAGGNITRLQIQRVSASKEDEVTVTFNGYGRKENFGTVTAYLWQTLSEQKPLSKAYPVPKNN